MRVRRRDLALVGIGLRSNYEACHQLMSNDWLGTRRLAVVRDEYEQHQACIPHMHTELPDNASTGDCNHRRVPI